MLLKIIKQFIIKPDTHLVLGRWNTINSSTASAGIKNIMANYDHCGDMICHDPKEISKSINNEISKSIKVK